jgi:Zn finger protein HypA/HybF involved in hydrogenase expression
MPLKKSIHFPKWDLWCEQCIRDVMLTPLYNRKNEEFQFKKRKNVCRHCGKYERMVLNVFFESGKASEV